MTTNNRLLLRPGRVVNHPHGRFAVTYLEAADHPLVELVIHTGGREEHHGVRPGERFALGEESWLVERVENAGSREWTVVLQQSG